VGLLALSAGAASATITVVQGGVSNNPDENVLLNSGLSGTSVVGFTNNTHTSITFTGTETLTEPPSGQARIEAVDGSFTQLTIAPTNPLLAFTKMELNIDALASGNATVQFFNQFNVAFGGVYVIGGNGQNFFNAIAVAQGGDVITRAVINSTVQVADVQQVRVSFADGIPTHLGVPEPATWAMMILGMGMVGLGLRMRRRNPLAA
jgi:hypothetical protein